MKALEVKDKLMEYIMAYLGPKGFKYKRVNNTEFKIVRKRENGNLDRIVGGIDNYNPRYKIQLGNGMTHKIIIDILYQVNEKISLGAVLQKDMSTFSFKPNNEYYGNKDNIFNWHEPFTTEEGLREQVDKVIEYLENGGMAAFDKYQDLREVDKIFNNLDNMWDPIHSRIGYSLGGYDYLTRIIIAKLSGNPNYEKIVQWSFEWIEREYKVAKYPDSWVQTKLETETLVEILKDIQPLYDSYE